MSSEDGDTEYTVLFADIAGSTHLYDQLGDQVAQKVISTTLKLLSQVTIEFNGLVVKTIGDEVMCRFDEADHAIYAACAMNEMLHDNKVLNKVFIAVRIGMNTGQAILDSNDNDIFGDAVNVASRMADIATANKIILTKKTAEAVSPELFRSRLRIYDRERVKGKTEKVDVYEVLWNPNDVTRMATASVANTEQVLVSATNTHQLELKVNGEIFIVAPGTQGFEIGRGRHCDLYLDANLASRSHAFINYQRGKFVIHDESTNGSYVQAESGKSLYLKREDMPLAGNGMISLGKPIADAGASELIYYKAT